MNSFALLQDDVEDATDFSPTINKKEEKIVEQSPEERPAESVQDAQTEVDQVKDHPEKKDEQAKEPEDKPKSPPKEKEMSLEEYLEKKAQLSSGLASLNSRTVRKANDGAGFEKMSVLKKSHAEQILDGVPVKEVHENKALKDSTHAAVAKNAEIQKFFQKENGDRRGGRGRGGDGRRGYDGGRGRGRGRGSDRYEGRGDRDYRGDREFRGYRDYRRDQRGGYGRDRGGRDDSHGGQKRFSDQRSADVPVVPNVDDTAAFPSL